MLTQLQAENFKSWKNTGPLKMAPLTGFFGTNSSGKTSLLQILLMLKQTVESPDRSRVLHTGDDRALVDLGTFYDLIHSHIPGASLDLRLNWTLKEELEVNDPEQRRRNLFKTNVLNFETSIREVKELITVDRFSYQFEGFCFGMKSQSSTGRGRFELLHQGFAPKRVSGRAWQLPKPVKCYGFPDEATGYFQNTGFLSSFALEFEEFFSGLFYLGPLRDYPRRSYVWAGERPTGVGRRGEDAIAALLAARAEGQVFRKLVNKRHKNVPVEEHIANWLQRMGLVHKFSLKPIAKNRKEYEVRVQIAPGSAEVSLTDVGFGVSQILPVLVLCYYVPEGSTIIFEQPEIHLHPAVQSHLADVFIEVATQRNVQILVESHSEHLLSRLQTRIAEEKIDVSQTALYFCRRDESGLSQIEQLEVDMFGDISNWPADFFGDEVGELVAKTRAGMQRQLKGATSGTAKETGAST